MNGMDATFRTGIVGCGKMGTDLFDWLCGFPFDVVLVCKSREASEEAEKAFLKKLKRALKYKLLDKNTFEFRINHTLVTTDPEPLATCDLVIESITENLGLKKALFQKLDKLLPSDRLLTSNSSSLPPDALFEGLTKQSRCLGLHFFFPAAMKNLVEINVGSETSGSAVSRVREFLKTVNKFHLVLKHPNHFLFNRIFLKMQAECALLVAEGSITVQQIDSLVRERLFPIGVFEFFDHVGNDVMLQSVNNYRLYEDDPAFFDALITLLEEQIVQGRTGRKARAGFYDYPVRKLPETGTASVDEALYRQIINRYLDGVFAALRQSGCSREEMEHIVSEYMDTEVSPFELAEKVGYFPG